MRADLKIKPNQNNDEAKIKALWKALVLPAKQLRVSLITNYPYVLTKYVIIVLQRTIIFTFIDGQLEMFIKDNDLGPITKVCSEKFTVILGLHVIQL